MINLIKKGIKDDIVLLEMILTLYEAIIGPSMQIVYIGVLDIQLFALGGVLKSILTLKINSLWSKHSDKIIKHSVKIVYIDYIFSLVTIIPFILGLIGPDILFLCSIIHCIFTKLNMKCYNRMIIEKYTGAKERDEFDNTTSTCSSVFRMIGGLLAILVILDLETLFIGILITEFFICTVHIIFFNKYLLKIKKNSVI